jgi:hypothetical protein
VLVVILAGLLSLLAGCGIAITNGTLSPRNEAPGTNVKTLTLGLYENGRRKLMSGAVGNVVFNFVPGEPVMMNFTFRGVYQGVSDTAILTPTYPTITPIRASSDNGQFSDKLSSTGDLRRPRLMSEIRLN